MSAPILGLNIAVVNIKAYYRSTGSNIGQSGSGTGFFFRHEDKLYIVTSRHVLISEEEHAYPSFIRFKVHSDSKHVESTRTIDFELYNKSQKTWLEHPSGKNIDIALLDVTDLIRKEDAIFEFNIKSFPNREIAIDASSVVAVCGYPLGIFDPRNNLPIIRTGTIASAYWYNFDEEPKFLLDSTLHEGMSGGPVVLLPTGMERTWNGAVRLGVNTPPYLLGIHTGGFLTNNGQDVQLYYEYYFWIIAQILEIPLQ